MRAGLDPTAAYMVISNQGGADDAYLSATTDLSPEAQLHSTVKDGDFVAMEEVERLPIPARGTVELRPAGLHLMVSDFSRVLEAGETVAITLNFEKSGAVHVDAQIRAK